MDFLVISKLLVYFLTTVCSLSQCTSVESDGHSAYMVLIWPKLGPKMPSFESKHCAGALIRPNAVLASMGCLKNITRSLDEPTGVRILAGPQIFGRWLDGAIIRHSVNIFTHKEYTKSESGASNDIAIIITSWAFLIDGKRIKNINLATVSFPPDTNCIAHQWTNTDWKNPGNSWYMRTYNVTIINSTEYPHASTFQGTGGKYYCLGDRLLLESDSNSQHHSSFLICNGYLAGVNWGEMHRVNQSISGTFTDVVNAFGFEGYSGTGNANPVILIMVVLNFAILTL